jgi:uncharacterized damage-inducible protein DinB
MDSNERFLTFSADKLLQYTGRIATCLDQLSPEQIWTRNSENENAVGNLVLHLCGNVRQWIGFGVAGLPDVRARDAEFAARGGASREELKDQLRSVVAEAADQIRAVRPERLAETTRVQGYEMTVLEAIYHVVEHFAHHAGQIIFATKLLTGADLAFYAHLKGAAHGETSLERR